MTYDLEKYRDKREKVLGIKKRGLGLGVLLGIVSMIVIGGLGGVAVQKSVAYLSTRHLDDAIYKLQGAATWPAEITPLLAGLDGVKNVVTDTHGTRLVVTFDRTTTDTDRLSALLRQKGLSIILLNRVGHRQRIKTLKKEAELEAI